MRDVGTPTVASLVPSAVRVVHRMESTRGKWKQLSLAAQTGEAVNVPQKHAAENKPGSIVLAGVDSQVALGSLVKERSASPSITAKLRTMLPFVTGACVRPDYFYV